jgi:hypothetical protein
VEEEEEGVGERAVRFGCLLGIMSQSRYQLLACWEGRGLRALPPQAQGAALVLARFANCYVAGLLGDGASPRRRQLQPSRDSCLLCEGKEE